MRTGEVRSTGLTRSPQPPARSHASRAADMPTDPLRSRCQGYGRMARRSVARYLRVPHQRRSPGEAPERGAPGLGRGLQDSRPHGRPMSGRAGTRGPTDRAADAVASAGTGSGSALQVTSGPLPGLFFGNASVLRYAATRSSRHALPLRVLAWVLPPSSATSRDGSSLCISTPPGYGVAASRVDWTSSAGVMPFALIFSFGPPWKGQYFTGALNQTLPQVLKW